MDHLNDNVLSVEEVVFVLLETLKSNGTFDEFRRDCVSNIDAKPTFHNWKQRIESNINKFLSKIKYTPELNKNSIRERLRKHLFDGRESREIEDGADRILTQVFASRTLSVFETKIEKAVNEYLGIKNEKTIEQNGMQASSINVNNLTKVSINTTNSDDNEESPSNHTDNAEVTSPEFEPLISGLDNDNSNDESISGMSDLNSIGGSPVQCITKNNFDSNSNSNSNGINSEKSSVDKFQSILTEKNGISHKNDDDVDNVTDVNKNTNNVEKHKISDNNSKSKHHYSMTDKQSNSQEKSSSNHHHNSDKSKDHSQEKSEVKKSSSSKDKKSSSHSKHRSESRDKDRKHRNDKKSHHSDRERTPKRDRKDSRSDMKDKSSSLCKEPKSTNNNRSDDESNAGGSSKQQKSSLHKNRSSTSEKSKSSSSNHKSSRKDNGNKDDSVKSKEKLLGSSKHSNRKNSKTSTSKKHDKNFEKKESKAYNYQNVLFSNDDQDMANVLLSIGGTVVPEDNKMKTENMTLSQRENMVNTQNDIHDKLSNSLETSVNIEETNKFTDQQGDVKIVNPMQNASIESSEDLLELNDSTEKTEEPHDILSQRDKLNFLGDVTSKKNSKHKPVDSISDIPPEQTIDKITETNKKTDELVDPRENVEKKSSNLSLDSSILRNSFISSDTKEKDLMDVVICQDENISVREVFKCKNPLQKIEQLNCDIKTSSTFDISDVSMDKDKKTVLNNILTTKTIQSPKELNYLNEIPTPNKVGMILKLQKVGLNKYKRKSSTEVEIKCKKVRPSKHITFLNEIDIFQKNLQSKSNNVKIDNDIGSETKTTATNSTSVQCTKKKNDDVSGANDSVVLNGFKGFTKSQAVPCQNYANLKNLLDNHIADLWKFEGFAITEVIPCKNRDKVYAELVKLKCNEEFHGFTDEEVQVCFGYKQVKQHLEQAKQQFITWLKSQHEAVGGGNGTQNGRNVNEMMAILYESDKITDIKSNIIYSQPNKSNSNLEEITATPNNNNRNEITTSNHWVAEQEMKYKLLPVKVKLERLLESRSNDTT